MDDENKPAIPILRDDKKAIPPLKIKGLGERGSLIERLKHFKKKDLMFILSGLGVLVMAPLAEHFLMSPERGDSRAFKEGWSFRDGPEGLGKGGSPYEGGVSGLAPGGLIGGQTDIITPLNARDPSALVMGPGATPQPPATQSTTTPPAQAKTEDWKNALADSAAKGAAAAAKKGGLPVPKVSLPGGGLRGLGVAAGGAGASFNLPPVSASNVPNVAAGSNALTNVRPVQGYRSPAGSRGAGMGSNAANLDALKKAAAAAAGDFNRNGSAVTNLENAASRSMPGGEGGGGVGGGKGSEDKASGQSSPKDSKSADGQSLEFLRLKAEQEKAIDLKWKLKEKQAMLWPNLREKILEEAVMTPMKALTAQVADFVKNVGGDHTPKKKKFIECLSGPNKGKYPSPPYSTKDSVLYVDPGDGKTQIVSGALNCHEIGSVDADGAGGGKAEKGVVDEVAGAKGDGSKGGGKGGADASGGVSSSVGASLDSVCGALDAMLKPVEGGKPADAAVNTAAVKLKSAAQAVVNADDMLGRGSSSGRCGAGLGIKAQNSVTQGLSYSSDQLMEALGIMGRAGKRAKDATTAAQAGLVEPVKTIRDYFEKAPQGGTLPDAKGASAALDSLSQNLAAPFAPGNKWDEELAKPLDEHVNNADASLAKTRDYMAYARRELDKANGELNGAKQAVAQVTQDPTNAKSLQEARQTIQALGLEKVSADYAGNRAEYVKQAGENGNAGILAEVKAVKEPVRDMSDFAKHAIAGEDTGSLPPRPLKQFADEVKKIATDLPASLPKFGESDASKQREKWLGSEPPEKKVVADVTGELKGRHEAFFDPAMAGLDNASGAAFKIHAMAADKETGVNPAVDKLNSSLGISAQPALASSGGPDELPEASVDPEVGEPADDAPPAGGEESSSEGLPEDVGS
jgi:hypothetical protein